MRIVTWNIRGGGGSRVGRIAEAIGHQAPDLAILTEFRQGKSGTEIRNRLADIGLVHQIATDFRPRVNGILVAGCVRLGAIGGTPSALAAAGRLLPVRVAGLNVVACYFPQGRAKIEVFDHLANISPRYLGEATLLLGDFNTGRHRVDEEGATFIAADRFERLLGLGWVDAWRVTHPDAREYSWYSTRGSGFRIDHVLASPKAVPRVSVAEYSPGEREQGFSDHSPLLIEYRAEGAGAAESTPKGPN
jgi:exodeoxyribonuclease III